jgi:hypothetical protein
MNEKLYFIEIDKKTTFLWLKMPGSDLDPDNKKYYLLNNARVHKTKKFNKFSLENDLNMNWNALYTKKNFIFFWCA